MQTDNLITRLIASQVIRGYITKSLAFSICPSPYLESGLGANREYQRSLVHGFILKWAAESLDGIGSILE